MHCLRTFSSAMFAIERAFISCYRDRWEFFCWSRRSWLSYGSWNLEHKNGFLLGFGTKTSEFRRSKSSCLSRFQISSAVGSTMIYQRMMLQRVSFLFWFTELVLIFAMVSLVVLDFLQALLCLFRTGLMFFEESCYAEGFENRQSSSCQSIELPVVVTNFSDAMLFLTRNS